MAPQEVTLLGTRPTETEETVDKDILAPSGHTFGVGKEEHTEQSTSCLYSLEKWVFLGSLSYDGEEMVEAIRCRHCGSTGRITR